MKSGLNGKHSGRSRVESLVDVNERESGMKNKKKTTSGRQTGGHLELNP